MKNILIIDNSNFIINVFKDLFSKKNDFRVFTSKSLLETKVLCETKEFYLVITNLVLPDALNGELLAFLKKNSLSTIILSSQIDLEFIESMHDENVIDYVLKDSIHSLEKVSELVELLVFMENKKVLIIDDSKIILNALKNCLENLFLKVVCANNGEEALNFLEKNKDISLIISDLNMPKLDGPTFLKEIKKDDTLSSIPIIMISNEINDSLKIFMYKNGANDFLRKPIIPEILKSKVLNIFTNIKRIENINNFNRIFDENIIASSTNSKGIIKSVSKAFCEISGYSKEELIGKHHNIVRHEDMPKSLYKELWKTIKSGNSWKGEIKNKRKDGTSYWVSSIIEPLFDNLGNIYSYNAVRQDITDKKRIYELSIKDALTSLYNRRHFNDIAQRVISETVRNNNTFAFLILDIDNFKKYNDTYGHQEGDYVLKEVSKSLKETFKRSDDLTFRLGGEEFGVLISTKEIEDVFILVEQARLDIENLNIKHEGNKPIMKLTASFGVTIIKNNKERIYKLDYIYKKADECLYLAKENGRNRVESIKI